MGKQTGLITFTGKLGKLIGYEVDGVPLVRSMPEHVERSYATKRSALDFGTASKAGRVLRRALLGELELPKDGKLVNRINQVLLEIVKADTLHFTGQRRILPRHLSALNGFNLNEATRLDQLLTFMPVLTKGNDSIRVSVRPFFKKAPGTTHIEIKAVLTEVDLAKKKHTTPAAESILIDLKAIPDQAELVLPWSGKEISFVVLQVLPFQMVNNELTLLEDVRYLAADIIGVLLPDENISAEAEHPPAGRTRLSVRKPGRRSQKPPPPLE